MKPVFVRRWVVLFALAGFGAGQAAHADVPDWQAVVLKVEVVRLDGAREIGSAIVLGNERVVTNCHVLREASSIRVMRGDAVWSASMDAGDEYRDLCFLRVPGFSGTPPPIAEPEASRVGLPVVAVGYSRGSFGVSAGRVKGLFNCTCDGGRVIQTSAAFEPGASGGGLFDREGRLLGILTFKSGSGGNFHFAVPVGWMKQLGNMPSERISGRTTFWESATRDSGYFLVACDYSAKRNWRGLLQVAGEWTRQEPYNPEAWMAWGRARLNLGDTDDAIGAFRKALQLDSTHAEAWWELQKLEVDLGRSLTGAGD
jgi:hypothetical protein